MAVRVALSEGREVGELAGEEEAEPAEEGVAERQREGKEDWEVVGRLLGRAVGEELPKICTAPAGKGTVLDKSRQAPDMHGPEHALVVRPSVLP